MLGITVSVLLPIFIVLFLGIYFFKSTKGMPKSWYEWKMEFRLQAIGILGLTQDYILKKKNHVELYKQPDRIALITGGNRGFGLRIVEKLLRCEITVTAFHLNKARIILSKCVRNPQAAKRNLSKILDFANMRGELVCDNLDTSDLTSIKEFAGNIQRKYEKIDILINNAGIMFAPFKLTKDGFESHFATNYLGHFLLTHMLLPLLEKAGNPGRNSRIINVSSIVQLIGKINYNDINLSKRYHPVNAYNQSKLAQLLFTKHLDKVVTKKNMHIQVHAVHPGVVNTDLFVHSNTTAIPGLKRILFKTPEEGSRSVVYAAISPNIEGEGGTYLSNCVKTLIHADVTSAHKCEKFFNFSCGLLGIQEYGSENI